MVAEAVALALEAVAAEAAESVLVTAAAVTGAATRAAEAAESAKGARAFAAAATAQSVAAEVARVATHVQARAEVAAAQVRQAASLAAAELAQTAPVGDALKTERVAALLEATVQAAAKATADDTTQAAYAVRKADAAAAAQVSRTFEAAEEVINREVDATAQAQLEVATAAAAGVALETDARAAAVALTARRAAAERVVDDGRPQASHREAQDHFDPATAETDRGDRAEAIEQVRVAAEERNARAELRDRVAEERERTAGLRDFREGQADDDAEARELRIEALLDRRAAAQDRSDARTDRAAADLERARLIAQCAPAPGNVGVSQETSLSEVAELSQHLRAPLHAIIASVETLGVALRASDDRLQFLVDAVTDYAIIALDRAGTIESWNTGAQRLKGYSSDEALGRHFSIFYTAKDRDNGVPQTLLGRARAEGSCNDTGWRVRKDGSQFWGDIVINAVHDDHGNLTGFVKVVRDLTEQHRLELSQDSFYNVFEHDFRVPITAIKGFAELIGEAEPADVAYLAERIESNADRLLRMAQELVDYAKLRSGLAQINVETLDMSALARRSVANLAQTAGNHRVRVTADAPVHVLADPAALDRVITNLVMNALKYSRADSEINLVCTQVEDAGVLSIVDHGRGIDERDLGSIFLEFERGRLAQPDSGTGLGLASVHRLLDRQHGTVAITSEVGVGTIVTVELPLAPRP